MDSGIRIPEVEAEQEHIDSLISFYNEHGHLNSRGVPIESLSYLKAAALCVILEKEAAKRKAAVPRVRKAIDSDIYRIVSKMRDDPLRDIKLPQAMHDYVIQQGGEPTPQTPSYVRESAPSSEQNKLDMLLDRLDPRLKKRREGAWQTLRSTNPDRLSQAANSMVELLDQVIGQTCKGAELSTYLQKKYETHQKTEWIDATRRWIGKTKDNLHSTKHHVDSQSEQLTKSLLTNAETIMLILLE
ncbi:MAG TPA: hypothetical protein VJ011_12100 [Steroidobacteraceae bacterium]|nr:hypothetical protein [Steroidobacteraceae bacterium]